MTKSQKEIKELAKLLLPPQNSQPVTLRQGIVSDIGMGKLSIQFDGPFAIGGVSFLSTYKPIVGDTVMVLKNGPDLTVIDQVQPGGLELEPWHNVGDTEYGEPAWQNGWQNDSASKPAQFYMDPDGWCHLQGAVDNPTAASYSSAMFTLPVGYRPEGTRDIPVLRNDPGAGTSLMWLIRVKPNGEVSAGPGTNTNKDSVKDWISLTGVRFQCSTGTDYERINEWTPFGNLEQGWKWDATVADGWDHDWPGQWHRWDGLVRCRGKFQGGTNKKVARISEQSARHRWSKLFATSTTSGFGTYEQTRLDVYPDGREIQSFNFDPAFNQGLVLDGLQWFSNIPESYWTEIDLENGWVHYDDLPQWGPPGYYKDGYGEVHLKGLIKSGTFADGTRITVLPENCRPSQHIHMPAHRNGNAWGRVDVNTNGEVLMYDHANNGYFSLDSVSFRASDT